MKTTPTPEQFGPLAKAIMDHLSQELEKFYGMLLLKNEIRLDANRKLLEDLTLRVSQIEQSIKDDQRYNLTRAKLVRFMKESGL
jgi:hypothetical protein